MIRKVASGIYTYLPLGFRTLQKIMNIVREEMDRAGGQELLLPIVQPAELWKDSGRWDVYGEEMFRLKDRHDRDFCLGPTHEEIVTALVRADVSSYKQLPLMLYQIQNKYRDEKRPRFGLMRGREFVMKDLYSFDRDPAAMQKSYEKMYSAYVNVFDRCGLEYKVVEADSGAIGGNISHEFMVLANSGEAEIVYCMECDYAANVEKAECIPCSIPETDFQCSEPEMVHTPEMKTIEEVAHFLQLSPQCMIKSLLYEVDGEPVCVLIRGDRQINEIKLHRALGGLNINLADEGLFARLGLSQGFLGPVGLDLKIVADLEIPMMESTVTGANKKDYHLLGVVPKRDIIISQTFDLREVEEGEPCPQCAGQMKKARGIEVGQVFQLGTKYSDALEAVFNDEQGKTRKMLMGCYGIGVSRTMAAAIEQNHDEEGIIWPLSIAPFHVVVVPVSEKDSEMMQAAVQLYQELSEQGVETILDDRSERAGVKFKDADLIGYPFRIIVGKGTVKNKTVDIKNRMTGQEETVPLGQVCSYISSLVNSYLET